MFSSAMQNASLWNTTLPSSEDDHGGDHDDDEDDHHHHDEDHDHEHTHLAYIHHVSLKVLYISIGTVGVVDNLFVLVVFVLFVKITAKVFCYRSWSCMHNQEEILEFR